MFPELSIITVNFNNRQGLQKTVETVFSQSFKDFEYIVIDGGSIDGSKEVIEKENDKIAYWVSEKDNGIYHAMNKGIVRARGKYLLFLNSGDYLVDSFVLDRVFGMAPIQDIVYGDIIWDSNGAKIEDRFPDKLSFDFFARHRFLPHQGSFIKRSLFDSIGLYDESKKISSDWIFFMLAICKHNCSYKHIEVFISVCGRDGISCEPGNWDHIVAERETEMQKHFPALMPDYKAMQSLRKELDEVKGIWAVRMHNKLKRMLGR